MTAAHLDFAILTLNMLTFQQNDFRDHYLFCNCIFVGLLGNEIKLSNLQLLSKKITSKCCTAFCNSLRLLRPNLIERSCGRTDKALDL